MRAQAQVQTLGRGQAQVRRFEVDSLSAAMVAARIEKLDFLREATVHARMRRIGGALEEKARYDLVAIVVDGEGMFRSGSVATRVAKGALLFVPKDSVYAWTEVTRPLVVMEWSSMGEMKGMHVSAPVPAAFTLEEVGRQRLAGENVWNAFVRRPSMVFGLYMLPKKVGGDSALTHQWDEINLITRGTGKFQVGQDVMDVRPGDIIYVRKGNPHFFHSLAQDMDILIFFEMKSMEGKNK